MVPAQAPVRFPAMDAGVPGLLAMANDLFALVPAMQLDAFTYRVPETKEALKLTVALVVPCPEIMLAFVGVVQV